MKKLLIFAPALLIAIYLTHTTATAQQRQAASTAQVEKVPKEDVRLRAEFSSELTDYKKGFRLPEWAKPGRSRQIRFDGGPMFAACQFDSGWKYLTDHSLRY